MCIPQLYGKQYSVANYQAITTQLPCTNAHPWMPLYDPWRCRDGTCIDKMYVCDGSKNKDCDDRSDEDRTMCAQWNCAPGYTKCKDGLQCLKDSRMCDGEVMCRDKSDEDPAACSQWNCTNGGWKCKDGLKCLQDEYMCDGREQCRNGSDEDPAVCSQWNCTDGRWKCKDGLQCIMPDMVCNGKMWGSYGGSDCTDGSDEDPAVCAQWNCAPGYTKCRDGLQCVDDNSMRRGRCDGVPVCNDKSDEDPAICSQYTCLPGYTKCADNLQCIRKRDICDGRVHCNDASDELCFDPCLKIPFSHREKSIIRRCPEDYSVCLPVEQYCDGIAQCPDVGDEIQSSCACEDWGLHSCQIEGHDQLKCLNTKWLPPDGVKQCHALLHDLKPLLAPREMNAGLYHNHNISCILESS